MLLLSRLKKLNKSFLTDSSEKMLAIQVNYLQEASSIL